MNTNRYVPFLHVFIMRLETLQRQKQKTHTDSERRKWQRTLYIGSVSWLKSSCQALAHGACSSPNLTCRIVLDTCVTKDEAANTHYWAARQQLICSGTMPRLYFRKQRQ